MDGMNEQNLTSPRPPVRVLVVDDHPNTATTLARAISLIGDAVKVTFATNGMEALESARDEKVDILITDVVMPGMDGLELVERFRVQPAGAPAFNFLVTAYDVPSLKDKALKLDVNEIILKPVSPERICDIVRKALRDLDLENSKATLPRKYPAATESGGVPNSKDASASQKRIIDHESHIQSGPRDFS